MRVLKSIKITGIQKNSVISIPINWVGFQFDCVFTIFMGIFVSVQGGGTEMVAGQVSAGGESMQVHFFLYIFCKRKVGLDITG